ncbi:sigma-54-dependent Fis family transcriptional regulator [Deferribacter autotrophicus]|uniref:Sigma-54-dependent Fis family transcriptional regulator n=1 Tax=Deferribacter autotrophicus TaxID=500465 RepID=A0A5A8F6A3_9BACT|nr:sigma-54 dependent transcriptional regulator [Deferribacter autotrophicus]KAA0257148.1 sigma-54-dependent Fis family transcriptional regulator [Deferribacter autotrophicus]
MKILLIEDNVSLATLMKMMLEDAGYDVVHKDDGLEGLKTFEKDKFDIVITDIRLPGVDGYTILENIISKNTNIPIIIITAYGNIPDAVKAIKSGAFDYITKPFDNEEFLITVEKAAKYKMLKDENSNLKEILKNSFNVEIIGKSNAMKKVLNLAETVAPTNAPVLLVGESGTGKELIAKKIHLLSSRADKPFIAINCAAIPENLFESELFGHKKGSFTGAHKDKKGKIAEANKGTIFLDEIGEMPLNIQAKILRFLQEGEIEPVGETKAIKVDVRVIAATNRDLKSLVDKGDFREDLFYRLNVFPINLPPLRERKEDIPELINYFKTKYGFKNTKISEETLKKLKNYDWPGNIRELENLIYRLCIMAQNGIVTDDLLPPEIGDNIAKCFDLNLPDDKLDLQQLEKTLILKALNKFNGNKSKTADYLCLPRHVLLYRLEKFNIKD